MKSNQQTSFELAKKFNSPLGMKFWFCNENIKLFPRPIKSYQNLINCKGFKILIKLRKITQVNNPKNSLI